ncbi:SRPBCC family protein [Georgenia thermotolerans]|uniref:ATPase n=1 Tax=Georgenia thermotolerans TaxID=527326 RepID=A0A7J5UTD2_9MICO|nr:SRPBCC family protein [Georgenia thermotolerans]KAE8765545.1 ATPase [Georgenia thermotolerans]
MPAAFDPGPLLEVSGHQDGDRSTLVLRRPLAHPPGAVWAVLTDPELLGRWAPFTADRDLGSEGPATLTMIDAESRLDLPATVSAAQAPRLLEYTWGGDRMRWEVAPDDGGTCLTLAHTVEAPEWIPKVAAGWHLCLLVAEHLLDGAPIPPIVGEAAMGYGWQALADGYAGQLDVAETTGSD